MIVIPMAGLSQRFARAGYTVPKYMLDAHGMPLFDQAVLSFSSYFDRLPFLFVARDVAGTADFVASRCAALGVADFRVEILEGPTRGQAETVALGLDAAGVAADTPLTIFNIDTFRPAFTFPRFEGEPVDGFLETFLGEGDNWSFVRPLSEGSDVAAETSEKRPISRFCCTGLYHFGRAALFHEAYAASSNLSSHALEAGELYVAPLYNTLIRAGRDIRFSVIPRDEVIFCGIPSEYDDFRKRSPLY